MTSARVFWSAIRRINKTRSVSARVRRRGKLNSSWVSMAASATRVVRRASNRVRLATGS